MTGTTEPTFWVKSDVEAQAARMYNRQIFYRFQKQLMFTPKLHVDEIEKHNRYEVFKTKMLAAKDFRPRRYTVLVNLATEQFACVCCKFEKDGIVCSHILRVMVHLNLSELPEKYYIDRWKPKHRKIKRDQHFNIPLELTAGNRQLRFNKLSNKLIDLASEGSKTNDRYLLVVKESMKIEEKLEQMTLAEEQNNAVQKPSSSDPLPNHDNYGDDLQNPDVAKSKVRPQVGRYKTFAEQGFSKYTITCSHCGSHEHNFATCQFKHIDKSYFESNQKSSTKKSTGMSLPGV